MSSSKAWNACLQNLRGELPADQVATWLLPLHPVLTGQTLKLLAPNRYILDYVRLNLLGQIESAANATDHQIDLVQCEIGSYSAPVISTAGAESGEPVTAPRRAANHNRGSANGLGAHADSPYAGGDVNGSFTFDNHIEGNSNQLARAAAQQVGTHPGSSYNPLFIYGGVGLGKTHLMHAAGNLIQQHSPRAKVIYIRSELFVNDMVKALKNNSMNDFKRHYRSLDALLIDDIQFFARKTQSQEEFFHTFNSLLEGDRQIIITSDRIPKAMTGVEERLVSRFDCGLTVSIDPPELETRVAILGRKAIDRNVILPDDVAFFVANAVHSNVRELEGALNRIIANAGFTGRPIDIDLAREALRDLLVYRESRINIDSIQQTVAEYFKIRVADLLSKKRTRDIARPRQMAMSFAKEYTNMSLPQIGDRFGGRDHTTVMHACRKIDELLLVDAKIKEDYRNLQRLIGG